MSGRETHPLSHVAGHRLLLGRFSSLDLLFQALPKTGAETKCVMGEEPEAFLLPMEEPRREEEEPVSTEIQPDPVIIDEEIEAIRAMGTTPATRGMAEPKGVEVKIEVKIGFSKPKKIK